MNIEYAPLAHGLILGMKRLKGNLLNDGESCSFWTMSCDHLKEVSETNFTEMDISFILNVNYELMYRKIYLDL